MKTAEQVILTLQAHDIQLWVEEGKLRYRAPKAALTDDLRAKIAEHRTEILALLSQGATQTGTRQAIQPALRNHPLPLSFAQQRLWFLDQMESGGAYNSPLVLELNGILNGTALQQSLQEIVQRHESLRTTFAVADGEPYQVIHPTMKIDLPVVDLSTYPATEQAATAKQLIANAMTAPFDLNRGPMLRVRLLRLRRATDQADDEQHILLLTFHHIVIDGWSLGVFVQELTALYAAFSQGQSSPLPELAIQYADFACWQREYLHGERLTQQLTYWQHQLAGTPALLQLPIDRPRPAVQSFRGAEVCVEINRALTQKLRHLSQVQGATLYMTLLTAFQILMARYSGQNDIVIGSPIANRHHQELEPLIGFFANTIALRADLSNNPTFLELLAKVKAAAQIAYDHQDLPFERLVEALTPERSLNHNPLVQVVFALQNAPVGAWKLPGLQVQKAKIKIETTRFDLEFHCWEVDNALQVNAIYNTDLFTAATIEQMVVNWMAHLEAIVADPTQRILALPLATPCAGLPCTTDDCAKIAATLLTHTAIQECYVLLRQTVTNEQKPVAYLIARETLTPESLNHYVEAQLPAALCPYAYVPLTTLPLNEDGAVDQAALAQIPVIDAHLLQRWENYLRTTADLCEVAVVAEACTLPLPAYHISDLLPDSPSLAAAQKGSNPKSTAIAPTAPIHNDLSATYAKPLALSDGGRLIIPADAPKTLSEALRRTAERFPEKGIIHVLTDGSTQFQSYAELFEEANYLLHGLQQAGLRAGDRVLLQIEALPDYFPTFWACVLGGITPVTVAVAPFSQPDHAITKKMFNAWQTLGCPTILASDHLLAPLNRLKQELAMAGLRVLTLNQIRSSRSLPQTPDIQPNHLAFFQLSSGSTGLSKCIQETHQGIISHIHAAQQVNGYASTNIVLNWLSMDHVAPLLMYHIKDLYLGCQQIQVPTAMILATPLTWLDLIEAYHVTHTWSPNFGYKMLNDALAKETRTWDLSSICFFLNAGEQVTYPVVQEFLRLVTRFGVSPRAIQPAYGMAELCTAIVYANNFTLATHIHHILKHSLHGHLIEVADATDETMSFVDNGPPVPGIQLRIVDAGNQVLPEKMVGRIQISGAMMTPGYLNNPQANQEAFTPDGWYHTGDLGFLADGSLTITGREKELIIVHGSHFYCYEIEEIVHELHGIEPTFVAACGFPDANTGTEGLAIFFSPVQDFISAAAQLDLLRTIRTAVTTRLGITPTYVIPIAKSAFHKTTSGKIQRTAFQKALLAGEYQPILRQIDLAEGNANTLPNWFYQPIWQHKEPLYRSPRLNGNGVLIFMDELGLGEALAARLTTAGHAVVRVDAQLCEEAEPFLQLAVDHYCLKPNQPEAYHQLRTALLTAGYAIDHLLHLWSYDACGAIHSDTALMMAQEQGLESLLCLAQAWANHEDPCALWVVSNQAQAVLPTEAIAWAKAPLLGLLKTIPYELPWMRVRHIDLPHTNDLESGAFKQATGIAVEQVLQEMHIPNAEAEIAYRQGKRFVLRLAHLDLTTTDKRPLPLQQGGCYLITGGLGGIGYEVATYLLQHWQANLLLVGRTPLPSTPNSSSVGVDEPTQAKLNAYQQLTQLPGQVCYRAVDVCNAGQLCQAVAEVEAAWGQPLAGIFHLAGELKETLLSETCPQEMSAVIGSKVLGAWSLHQLMAQREKPFLVSFSSVVSSLGGVALGAYAAANRFLDAFAHHQRTAYQRPSYCVQWSMWDRIGMARLYNHELQQQVKQRGYAAITPRQGILSLLGALHQPAATYLIGLDGSHPGIQQQLNLGQPQQSIAAYYTQLAQAPAENRTNRSRFPATIIHDRFGSDSTCRLFELATMPRTIQGAIDYTRLHANMHNSDETEAAVVYTPRNDSEAQLLAIWQNVLNLEQIGLFDNFFQLGGHSLLATQVVSRIRNTFRIDLPLHKFFEYPTVASLAQLVEESKVVAGQQLAARTTEEREEFTL